MSCAVSPVQGVPKGLLYPKGKVRFVIYKDHLKSLRDERMQGGQLGEPWQQPRLEIVIWIG